jgi:hypothetical protein
MVVMAIALAALGGAEEPALQRQQVVAMVAKTVAAHAAPDAQRLTVADTALLLRATRLLEDGGREQARDVLVRAGDGLAQRHEDRPESAAQAASQLEILLDAWQGTGAERFHGLADSALAGTAALATSNDRPMAPEGLAGLAAALARGSAVLGAPEAVPLARKAVSAAHDALGHSLTSAQLDAVAHAALVLYECAGGCDALTLAIETEERLDQLAWDEGRGAYRDPAPFAVLDHLRLGAVTGDDAYLIRGRRLLAVSPETLASEPLRECAAAEAVLPQLHLTVIGRVDEAGTATLLAAAQRDAVLGLAVAVLDESQEWKQLRKRFPAMPPMPRKDKLPTAYLCTETACDPPTTDANALLRRIAELSRR